MRECFFKRMASLCLMIASLPLASSMVANAQAGEALWQDQFLQQVDLHPAIISLKEKVNSAELISEGSTRPIYNPELSTDVEREGDENNYRIGISQTIDWQDKLTVRKERAAIDLQAAKDRYLLTRLSRSADGLRALVSWQAASRQAALASEQETQLDAMLAWIDERQKTGDVGQIDAELAVLGLSQQLNATALAQASLKQMEAVVSELLPDFSSKQRIIPESFWLTAVKLSAKANRPDKQDWLQRHPAVSIARAEWDVSRSMSTQVKQNTKADPTIAINAGKTGDDNVLGLSLSLPINVRNSYSAEVKAAQQEILAAEAAYYAVRRQQQSAMASSFAVLKEYQSRVVRWRQLMKGRGERGNQLINQQWRSGDLDIPEYLRALQQLADGLSAGIELEKQFQLARIDWLLQSGQLNTALAQ